MRKIQKVSRTPFNIVAATNENTVATEYESVKTRSDSYQSEVAMEKEFIRLLTEQGYEYLQIHSEKDLIANLRRRLEVLNGIQFSEDEWSRFFNAIKDASGRTKKEKTSKKFGTLTAKRLWKHHNVSHS